MPHSVWARLIGPESTYDLTGMITRAPLIFTGVVADVSVDRRFKGNARIRVTRWYRGGTGPEAVVNFWAGASVSGHSCIYPKPGSPMLVFATAAKRGHLDFVDDCFGAVSVSRLLSPGATQPDVLSQMVADFSAGLADPDLQSRLFSIQRLGGLKSRLTLLALHGVIEHGAPVEQNWATYAALRSGDTTVLPRVCEMFVRGQKDVPAFDVAWELSQLKDRAATLGLVQILETASDADARKYAIEALGRNLKASEALPAIAAALSDADAGVRFYALNAMREITGKSECTLSVPFRVPNDLEPKLRECARWWNEAGKLEFPEKR
jgi:hypothetical protein